MDGGGDWRLVVGLGNPGDRYAATRHNIGWLALDRLRERRGWPDYHLAGAETGSEGYYIYIRFVRLQEFARKWPVPGEPDRREGASVAVTAGPLNDATAVFLAKPLWYMNKSGAALVDWLDRIPEFGLDAERRKAWLYRLPPEVLYAVDPATENQPLAEGEDPFATMLQAAEAEGAGESPEARRERGARAKEACRRMLVVVDDIHLPLGRMRFRDGGSDGGHNGLADLAGALETENYPRLRLGIGSPPAGVDQVDWVLGAFADEESAALDGALDRAVAAIETWARHGLDAAQQRYNGAG